MKQILNITLISLIAICFSSKAAAQQGTIQMSNGINVRINTKITPSGNSSGLGNIYSSNSGNVIHRVLTDRVNRIYFGYDLLIKKHKDKGKFTVSIKPLSKTPDSLIDRVTAPTGASRAGSGRNRTSAAVSSKRPDYKNFKQRSLPKYPDDITVSDDDIITLDLLENRSTKAKISDLIRISESSGNFTSYSSNTSLLNDKPAKDFSIDDIIFRIERPIIYIDEKKYSARNTIAGKVSWVYIKGKGRFIFSIQPQPGYNFRKIGTIRNNLFSYEFKNEKYKFVSNAPILGLGGNWNFWVMHDPDYQPRYETTEENPFIFGAADSVKTLFR
ncbi:MAG: hypothetical protein HKN25_13860 [Pyrinomonadaceae bacterium]|nr:hypothetical protein [Pyrinomonadaceae bacterium]